MMYLYCSYNNKTKKRCFSSFSVDDAALSSHYVRLMQKPQSILILLDSDLDIFLCKMVVTLRTRVRLALGWLFNELMCQDDESSCNISYDIVMETLKTHCMNVKLRHSMPQKKVTSCLWTNLCTCPIWGLGPFVMCTCCALSAVSCDLSKILLWQVANCDWQEYG